METTLLKKQKALDYFTKSLLNSKAKKDIGKIFLFGSMSAKTVRPESDVDLLVFSLSNLEKVRHAVQTAAFEATAKYGESLEPLIYEYALFKQPNSYFIFNSIKQGREIYSMSPQQLKNKERLVKKDLADDYLSAAKFLLKNKKYRQAVDAAYNAAELSVKALLLDKLEKLPATHGGLVQKFSEIFIKEKKKFDREIGRQLHQALEWRNRARYEGAIDITSETAKEIVNLASKFLNNGKNKQSRT